MFVCFLLFLLAIGSDAISAVFVAFVAKSLLFALSVAVAVDVNVVSSYVRPVLYYNLF